MKTPQIPALPGVTPLGIAPLIHFRTRAGHEVYGRVVADYGHALAVKVERAKNSLNLVGRVQLFPKNDMEIV